MIGPCCSNVKRQNDAVQGFPILRKEKKKKSFPCSIQKPNAKENSDEPYHVHRPGASRNVLGRRSRHALQVLPDPRRGHGKRYSLALLLCLVILAK
jgi:hypothetical protein